MDLKILFQHSERQFRVGGQCLALFDLWLGERSGTSSVCSRPLRYISLPLSELVKFARN